MSIPRMSRVRGVDYLLLGLAACILGISTFYSYQSFDRATGLPFWFGICAAVLLALSSYFLSHETKATICVVVCSILVSTYVAEIYVARRNSSVTFVNEVGATIGALKPATDKPWRSILMGHDVVAGIASLKKVSRGKAVDTRLKIAVVDDLIAQGVPRVAPFGVYPMFNSSRTFEFSGAKIQPLGGPSFSNAVACNEDGEWVILKLDRHGFNNPNSVWDTPLDIAFVGASDVFGLCVNNGDNLVDNIRRVWPRTLNLGFVGSGPVSMLRRMYEYLPDQKPKVVLFEYNDYLLTVLSQTPVWAYNFAQAPMTFAFNRMGLADLQPEIDAAIFKEIAASEDEERARLSSLLARRKSDDLISESWKDFLLLASIRKSPIAYNLIHFGNTLSGQSRSLPVNAPISTATSQQWGHNTMPVEEATRMPLASPENLHKLQLILQRANDLVKGWGGKLVFTYLPLLSNKGTLDKNIMAAYAVRGKVLEIARSLGIDVIDLEHAFDDQPDPFSYFPLRPVHYSVKGHMFIADKIIEAINKKKLLHTTLSANDKR
jgi:hypothetical protein